MSDWFKNPASEIPDEMWRAPTPMQRQADAVVMWAELTGKHASLAEMVGISQAREGLKELGSSLRGPRETGSLGSVSADEIRKRMADRESRDKVLNSRLYATIGGVGGGLYGAHKMRSPLGALIGAGVGGVGMGAGMVASKGVDNAITRPRLEQALRDKEAAWKPGVGKAIRMAGDNIELTGAAIGAPIGGLRAYTEYREGKGGISKAEASLKGEIVKAQSQKADKKKIAKLRQKLQTAKSRRENIGATTAKGIGIGSATGALGAHALKRMRKAGPK